MISNTLIGLGHDLEVLVSNKRINVNFNNCLLTSSQRLKLPLLFNYF